MIIARSPLRISLGGGGTDLPSYYREYTGFVISAAIDKYVYVTVSQAFKPQLFLKYSKMEAVNSLDEVEHPLIREALRLTNIDPPHLDIVSIADIPAGTGLGSSGSFTTALLRALHTLKRNHVQAQELAEQACDIEINILKEPVGKQDQYISSYGGITSLSVAADGRVEVEPLRMDSQALANLEDNLLLFFTGYTRSASEILRDQDSRSKLHDGDMTANVHMVKQLGYEVKDALEKGDLRRFAELMHLHWENKKKRSDNISNSHINEIYDLARANGALGGKLIGAGGGGFLMFYTEDKTRLRRAMGSAGLREVRIRFDFAGAQVLAHS